MHSCGANIQVRQTLLLTILNRSDRQKLPRDEPEPVYQHVGQMNIKHKTFTDDVKP